jgi:hypothetical protein
VQCAGVDVKVCSDMAFDGRQPYGVKPSLLSFVALGLVLTSCCVSCASLVIKYLEGAHPKYFGLKIGRKWKYGLQLLGLCLMVAGTLLVIVPHVVASLQSERTCDPTPSRVQFYDDLIAFARSFLVLGSISSGSMCSPNTSARLRLCELLLRFMLRQLNLHVVYNLLATNPRNPHTQRHYFETTSTLLITLMIGRYVHRGTGTWLHGTENPMSFRLTSRADCSSASISALALLPFKPIRVTVLLESRAFFKAATPTSVI